MGYRGRGGGTWEASRGKIHPNSVRPLSGERGRQWRRSDRSVEQKGKGLTSEGRRPLQPAGSLPPAGPRFLGTEIHLWGDNPHHSQRSLPAANLQWGEVVKLILATGPQGARKIRYHESSRSRRQDGQISEWRPPSLMPNCSCHGNLDLLYLSKHKNNKSHGNLELFRDAQQNAHGNRGVP